MEIKRSSFGKLISGDEVSLITLKNDNSMEVGISNYGATIVSILTEDKNGKREDIVLGFDSAEGYQSKEYLNSNPYFGSTIGRFANRMKGGSFKINGNTVQISQNEGNNSLHGGAVGFDKNLWKIGGDGFNNEDGVGIEMSLVSPDGDQGYPGTLSVKVKFTLQNDNTLTIEYFAVCDKDTVVNLTNHSYFNLAGAGSGNIKDHRLMIPSDKFLLLDSELIPTGEIPDVGNSSLDYTSSICIGDAMKLEGNEKITGGYAHTWLLDGGGKALRLAGKLEDPKSGRKLEIHTTEPGILLYTGDGLDGSIKGKSGKVYEKWGGLCLETQKMPDAPNHDNFPSAFLKAVEEYRSKSVYSFSNG